MIASHDKPDNGRRTRLSGLALAFMIVGGVAACAEGITQQEWETIETWLTCEDCQGEELNDVVRIGNRAKPILSETLIGLPTDYLESLERRALAAWNSIPDPSSESSAFVEYHVSGIVGTAQFRSALALGALGAWDSVRIGVDSSGTNHYQGDAGADIQRFFFEAGPEVGYFSNDTATVQVSGIAGEAIASITVLVIRCDEAPQAFSPPLEGRCSSPGPVYRTDQTGEAGTVVFADLEEGIYQIIPEIFGTPFSQVTPASRLFLLVGDGDTETGEFTVTE